MLFNLIVNLLRVVLNGRPSRRAIAAAVKICGRRLERRWPFVPKAQGEQLNLGFDDVLEFQYARCRDFTALLIGAYDGLENDAAARFICARRCEAVFVEPQQGPYRRLQERIRDRVGLSALNVAVDEFSGSREMFAVSSATEGLPEWTEQLASFQREHVIKHESLAPGLSGQVVSLNVRTLSFDDLLDRCAIDSLDLLQIDAEGMDGQLLSWFPFHRLKPAVLRYEIAHMSALEHGSVRCRLAGLGYRMLASDSPTDDVAIRF